MSATRAEDNRRCSPSILEKVRHFEVEVKDTSHVDSISVNSIDSDHDYDNEFYSQYVQGNAPRDFSGLHKDGQGVTLPVSGSETVQRQNRDVDHDETQLPENVNCGEVNM